MDWLGILMALLGTILTGVQSVVEEKLFRKYTVSPLEAVGLMGVYGTIISIVVLIVLEFTGVEKTSETIYMMRTGGDKSTIIIIANVAYVISISLFNASGLMITKFGSAILRLILTSLRPITIWIVELLMKWNTFDWLYCTGLAIVLIGVIVYNYNYFTKSGSWKGDLAIRKAVLCCGARDPDAPKEEEEAQLEVTLGPVLPLVEVGDKWKAGSV